MQTNPPYPVTSSAIGFLNLTTTLQLTSSRPYQLTTVNLPAIPFLLLADRLAELYESVLSEQPEWLDEDILSWVNEEAVSTAVEQFLKRVNTLFPVHDEIWDVDLETLEWRLWEIPIMPMGIDEWYDGWDDLAEPIPYLLHMCHSRYEEPQSHQQDEFEQLYPDHQTPLYLEPHRLIEILRKTLLPEPLNALPDLILMLNHNTCNVWLDVGECALAEGGGYPTWCQENIAWLTEAWQQAEPLLQKIENLLNWKNGTPAAITEKITDVRTILLAAYEKSQQDESTNTPVPATAA
jgi:hypothetical protein